MVRVKLWKKQVIDTLSTSHEERRSLVSKCSFESGLLEQANTEIRYYCCRDYFPCIPARYVLSVMGSLGFLIVYALRVNISVALVAMVNETASSSGPHKRAGSNGSTMFSCQPTAPVFNWGPEDQGWVLSSFFYGYILTQIPGGFLATRFSGKHVFGLGVVLTSALTLLTPVAATTNIWLLVALRVLEGICEGVTYPAMHALLGKWAPPLERSRMATMALCGAYIGNVVAFPLSGLLCQCGFAGGWPSVFYLFGLSGIVWYVFWLFLVYESPSKHPRISYQELSYIETSLSLRQRAIPHTPWLSIFTSWPVWAIVIAHTFNNWGFYTLLTSLPTYLKDTQGINIRSNGLLSGIPFAVMAVVGISWGYITDFFRHKGLKTVIARKVNTALGFILPGAFLVICGYYGNNLVIAIVLMSLALGGSGLGIAGFLSNHVDIAPNYAGILMGITNTAATVPGIIAPFVAKLIASAPLTEVSVLQDQWRVVFIIAAEMYLAGAIIYSVLASGEVQPWATNDGENSSRQTKANSVRLGCESVSTAGSNGCTMKMELRVAASVHEFTWFYNIVHVQSFVNRPLCFSWLSS